MDSRCLIVLAIDTSGSMAKKYGKSEQTKIDILNESLSKFVNNLKEDILIAHKIDICVIEIKSKASIKIRPTPLKGFQIYKIEILDDELENIGAGIEKSFESIRDWRKKHMFAEFLKHNYSPLLVLVTDIDKNKAENEEKKNPFKVKIEKLLSKDKMFFYAICMGSVSLKNLFDKKIKNYTAFDNFDPEIFIKYIKSNLSQELQKKPPLFEEVALFSKYYILFTRFYKKRKKLFRFLFFLLLSTFLGVRLNSSRGIKIKIDKIIEINTTEINNYINKYPENKINITIKPEKKLFQENIKFSYEFKYNINNYQLGNYTYNSSEDIWLSSQILLRNLNDIEGNFKTHGEISIKITGETDAVAVSNIVYRGESGAIIDRNFYEEGSLKKITILNKDTITTNMQLAFLRGYSIWDLMRRTCNFIVSQKTHYQQIVKVNDNSNKIGGMYRRVKVEMTLYDVESITRAKAEPLLD